MAEPSASPVASLQEVVTLFEAKGTQGLGRYRGRPVLLHCGGEEVKRVFGYETRAIETPWHARVALSLAQSKLRIRPEDLARVTAAYPLLKRPGGPFPERIGVGRSRTADVSLSASSISKYHAYFTCEADGSWSLVDARSRNGTWIGGQRIEPGTPARVDDGAALTLGEEAFLFFGERGFQDLLETLARQR